MLYSLQALAVMDPRSCAQELLCEVAGAYRLKFETFSEFQANAAAENGGKSRQR